MLDQTDSSLHPLDYVVAAAILAVPMLIGAVYAFKDANKMTRLEYLLGGQRMTVIPVTLSTFITFQSAISLIGIPSEIYNYGTGVIFMMIGFMLNYVLCYFTFVPLMYPLQVTSIYEYLYLRFQSRAVRLLSTIIGSIQTTIYLSIALLSPSLALQTVVGMPMWLSVLVVGGIGTMYTVIGGIKSVIWTDVFQTIIVFVGSVVIIFKGAAAVGGFGKVWSLAAAGGRLKYAQFSPDPRVRMTVWGAVIGGIVSWLTVSYNQATLQRIRSLKTLKDAKNSFLLIILPLAGYAVVLNLLGVVTYAYFSHMRCDPYKGKLISNQNQIVPFFVYYELNDLPGMAGLYIATLFCGSLSTLSSGINALAANTVEDILERPLRDVSERTATNVTKISVAFYGILVCCIGYFAQYLKGPVTQMTMSVIGAFGTPILGMFLIGCAVPWSNKYSAIIGGVISLAFNLWIAIGSRFSGRILTTVLPATETDRCFSFNSTIFRDLYNLTSDDIVDAQSVQSGILKTVPDSNTGGLFLYDISYEWISVYGIIVSFVTGLLVSLCTRDKNWRSLQTNVSLIFPIFRRFFSLEENTNENELAFLKENQGANVNLNAKEDIAFL